MVALRALDSLAEKQLRRILDLGVDVFHRPVPEHRGVFARLARRRHDVPHELVVGHVFLDRLADPFMECVVARLAGLRKLGVELVAEQG